MDFTRHDDLAEHREAAAQWAARHLRPQWLEHELSTGTHHNPELHRILAQQGLLAAGWPRECGGSDVDVAYADAIFDAIEDFGLRLDGWVTTWMIMQTVLHVGTAEQKATIIPAGLRGEVIIALGYTEPGSGSDMAAATTKAVRDDDGWLIDGAKMFTSTAHESSHVFLLTRTNPAAPKHRGLTVFLVPLDRPGVEIRPVATIGGQRTNATFYSGVRVDDDARVGDVDGGWAVMRVAMVYERRAKSSHDRLSLVGRVAAWTRENGLFEDVGVQERLARMAIADEVTRLLEARADWLNRNRSLSAVEGTMSRLFGTVSLQRQHEEILDLIGPEAVLNGQGLPGNDPAAPMGGAAESAFRNSVVETIYGGASEILREIIAEHRLGLPRSRPAG
jgi:alkylation response protein AidB-like acyl-CoA dehydrogenase